MSILKVGMVQQSCTTDIKANIAKLTENICECAAKGAKLVVLQELHNSVYFCQTEDASLCDLAETIPGPSTEYFGDLAKRLGIVLVLSLFEKRAPGLYHNTAVVIEKDGSIAGKYRKMHIPDDPCFYENSISHRGIWASGLSRLRWGASACWSAGTSGTLRQQGSWP